MPQCVRVYTRITCFSILVSNTFLHDCTWTGGHWMEKEKMQPFVSLSGFWKRERRGRRKKLSPLFADVEPETNKICPLPDGKTSIYGSAMLNIHYPDWLHDMSHLGEVQCKLMNASDQVILAPVPLPYSALRTKFQLTHTHAQTRGLVLCSFFSFASYRPCHSYRILKWLLAFLARFSTVN